MEVLPLRPKPLVSEMVASSDFEPGAMLLATVALKEKTLSPAVTAPLVPSSKSACDAEPPMALRSAVTVRPVLAGLAPGATVTLSKVVLPTVTGFGVAEPVPLGLDEPAVGVREKSSTASPSSAPLASKSVQWIQKVAPLAMFKELIVELMAVRSAAALPFLAPTVTVSGVVKLSAATATQVPTVTLVAFRLYSKLRRSVRPAVPKRHSSPVYAMA